jgi:glycosyltransferase involved in cell wall biosynthesis
MPVAPASPSQEPPRRPGTDPGARRVLVLSGDVLPYPGLPTTGAGLRAWGIGHGLAGAGHDVTLLMPRHLLEALRLPEERRAELLPLTFASCDEALARWQPEVVVVQHWWLATLFDPGDVPLVIDLHGPMLLETLYQNHDQYEELLTKKVQALSRADFITCAGPSQQRYFAAWLALAGFDPRDEVIAVVPVSLPPELPPHQAEGEISFVYGGMYLPWQNPLVGLATLVERLEAHGRGRLHFFGGPHPVLKLAAADVEAIERQIARSDRVITHGLVARDALLAAYRRAHVAFDLMARNPERELAFTTRTVEYLWCGLPVVYNDYADLARLIAEYEAGWTVDPLDRAAIAAVVDAILADPAEVERRGRNAQRLVRERLTWDRTIAPLDAFCRQPRKRRATPHLAALAARPRPPALPPALDLLFDQLDTLIDQTEAANRRLEALAARPAAPSPLGRWRRAARRRLAGRHAPRPPRPGLVFAGGFGGGATHGQAFVRGAGALDRIDVLFTTGGRLNAGHIRLHVCAVGPAGFGPDLATVAVAAARLRDNDFHAFVFPALPPAPGQVYAFWLDAPDAPPDAPLGLWYAGAGEPAARQRYARGRPAPGQLVCRIHERPPADPALPAATGAAGP